YWNSSGPPGSQQGRHPHCSRRQRGECSPRTAGGEFGEMCRYRRGSRPQSTVGEGSVLVAEGRRCWVGGNVVFHSRGQERFTHTASCRYGHLEAARSGERGAWRCGRGDAVSSMVGLFRASKAGGS